MTRLPDNLDTEEALLGVLMHQPDRVIRDCWDAGLLASDFSRPQHGVIYALIDDRLKRGEPVDPIVVMDTLEQNTVPAERGRTVNALEFVGGKVGVMTIADRYGTAVSAPAYVAAILGAALNRELVLAGEAVAKGGYDRRPIAEVVLEAERRLAAARDRAEGRAGPRRVTDVADLLQGVLKAYLSTAPDDVVPFQLPMLQALGGGMYPGDIVVVGARSGVGKSWWGLDTIEQAVTQGRRAALFSMEMPKEQMVRRLLAMGGHNLTGIKKRALDYDTFEPRINTIDSWQGNLDIFDRATNVDRIHSVLSSARIAGKPYRIVVVDHLHLLDVPGGAAQYRINLNTALTNLKHLAVEHGITLVLLGQLVKPQKGDEMKRPTIFDLRESNGIGDIADYVLLLHREPDEQGHATNQGVVIVDKVRDGAGTCDIDVTFDPRTYRFREGRMFSAGAHHSRSAA